MGKFENWPVRATVFVVYSIAMVNDVSILAQRFAVLIDRIELSMSVHGPSLVIKVHNRGWRRKDHGVFLSWNGIVLIVRRIFGTLAEALVHGVAQTVKVGFIINLIVLVIVAMIAIGIGIGNSRGHGRFGMRFQTCSGGSGCVLWLTTGG